jgi:pyruvate formate lyase activating enzyme
VKVGGLVKTSLNDFPGRVAAVVFTQGCNLRCPFCHNGGLLPGEASDSLDEAALWAWLARRRGVLGGLVISGGEPTLQRDLADFIRRARDLGYAIKLDTNGTRPEVLAALLAEDLLDYVAMDIKAPWPDYARLCGVDVDVARVRRSVALLAMSGVAHEFRTTVVPALMDLSDVAVIRAALPKGSRHRVQAFVPDHALDPALREAVQAG